LLGLASGGFTSYRVFFLFKERSPAIRQGLLYLIYLLAIGFVNSLTS
jgi:membrane-associated PAP2 superfamily phosphatase